ncbi:hypothetical Protein YC6258_05202 [Gynuella sunshinyii YC6258]|uniref:Uncharacterized protein n=1 Tax=Gynuella sunshinyii YC6258 TaxID=1445510 RepID=A0A0C5VRH7_9GAMM|nr:hypothetical Protein YC6258_05202 [Gynuella sunshinyii YC6258]
MTFFGVIKNPDCCQPGSWEENRKASAFQSEKLIKLSCYDDYMVNIRDFPCSAVVSYLPFYGS